MGPVSNHGWLKVSGNRIADCRGKSFTLQGMSLFWSQWMPQFYNPSIVHWLHTDWGVNVVRASLAVHNDGYLDHPRREINKIRTVVEAAIAEGIYVIIDWHAHLCELEAAKGFFAEMARSYGHFPHVIFETWNEPDARYTWQGDIRPYHEDIISIIRHDAHASLIIAGTENFSQRVDIAAAAPLFDANTAYTLHFYAASHRVKLRQRAYEAIQAGIPLVATEYGTCEADGNGVFAPAEMIKWWRFLEAHDIGCLNWAISDKSETSAALRPGGAADGGWAMDELTPSGQLVRRYLRARHRHRLASSVTPAEELISWDLMSGTPIQPQ